MLYVYCKNPLNGVKNKSVLSSHGQNVHGVVIIMRENQVFAVDVMKQCVVSVVVHVNVVKHAKTWILEKCIVIDVYWNLVTLAKDEYVPCVLHNVTDIVMDVSAFSVSHNSTVPMHEFISHCDLPNIAMSLFKILLIMSACIVHLPFRSIQQFHCQFIFLFFHTLFLHLLPLNIQYVCDPNVVMRPIDLLRLQGLSLICASTCCKAVFAPHLDHAVFLKVLTIQDMYWNPLATS